MACGDPFCPIHGWSPCFCGQYQHFYLDRNTEVFPEMDPNKWVIPENNKYVQTQVDTTVGTVTFFYNPCTVCPPDPNVTGGSNNCKGHTVPHDNGYSVPTVQVNPLGSTIGWECPKCHRVYSPSVTECLGEHETYPGGIW